MELMAGLSGRASERPQAQRRRARPAPMVGNGVPLLGWGVTTLTCVSACRCLRVSAFGCLSVSVYERGYAARFVGATSPTHLGARTLLVDNRFRGCRTARGRQDV